MIENLKARFKAQKYNIWTEQIDPKTKAIKTIEKQKTMKTYVQFFTNSTGYVQGTIPPVFSKENIKPIELLGSDGIYILDGRNSIDTMIQDSVLRIDRLKCIHKIVGFEIRKGNLKNYSVIYKNNI